MNYLSSLLSMRRITSNHIASLLLRAEHNQQEYSQLTEELLTPFAFTSTPVKDRREKILTIQEAMSIHALNIHECTQTIETVLQPRMEEIDKILSMPSPSHLDSRRISSGNWATLARIQSEVLDVDVIQAGSRKVEESLAQALHDLMEEAKVIMQAPENLVVPNSRRLTNLTKTLVAHLS